MLVVLILFLNDCERYNEETSICCATRQFKTSKSGLHLPWILHVDEECGQSYDGLGCSRDNLDAQLIEAYVMNLILSHVNKAGTLSRTECSSPWAY